MKKALIITAAALVAVAIIAATQCRGTTKKGDRCKNQTNNASGYCYLHEAQK
jgi:hypothetical protein